ncbi:MAG TPA: ABC transporter permease [Lacunisphaera sp.]
MLSDLRFAFRLLLKSPGFSFAAIGALGLGIGLSTAIFNAFSGMLLRPFPHIRDENRLVFINSSQLNEPGSFYDLALPDFLDLRAETKTLEGLTTTVNRTMIFTGGETPIRALGADVSTEGFAMLGTKPHRGRLFDAADARPDAPRVALLGYALWHRLYGGREEIIGQTVTINGHPHTLVGVMPPGFAFPDRAELWTPLGYFGKPEQRGSHSFPGWARLKPGVTLDAAQAEVATIAARLAREHPTTNEGKTLTLRLVREEATEGIGLLMKLMLGAAICVLLIACANVANLLLARAAARGHEIAIRVSVGASRWQIVRQILVESLLLGVIGGTFGLLVAAWADSLLFSSVPEVEIPFWMTFDFDWRVFAFAAGAAIGSALLFGLFPALQVSRATALVLREGGRTTTGSPRARLVRQGLVVAQVALSAVLLIAAGLFVRSFLKLHAVNPGFDPSGVITFRVGLPPTQYQDKAQIRRFFEQLEPALAALPGVKAVGSTTILPGDGENRNVFLLEGQPEPATINAAPQATVRTVSAGYFAAMRIPLVRGRSFTADDRPDTPAVALVDEQFAARWFPGVDPVGRRFILGLPEKGETRHWIQIVGIVGNVPQKLDRPYERGGIYMAHGQNDQNFVNYAVHVQGDPATYGPALAKAVLSVQSDIPIYNVETMERLQALAYWERRFFSQIFGAFGLGALFLAALGVYGVMSYAVQQRTSEIGVRLALGATEGEVIRLIGRQGAWLVALGMGTGLLSALGVTRLMAGLLYGISPSDPPTYVAFTLVLAVTGLVACILPVRRAAKTDPMVALRSD